MSLWKYTHSLFFLSLLLFLVNCDKAAEYSPIRIDHPADSETVNPGNITLHKFSAGSSDQNFWILNKHGNVVWESDTNIDNIFIPNLLLPAEDYSIRLEVYDLVIGAKIIVEHPFYTRDFLDEVSGKSMSVNCMTYKENTAGYQFDIQYYTEQIEFRTLGSQNVDHQVHLQSLNKGWSFLPYSSLDSQLVVYQMESASGQPIEKPSICKVYFLQNEMEITIYEPSGTFAIDKCYHFTVPL